MMIMLSSNCIHVQCNLYNCQKKFAWINLQKCHYLPEALEDDSQSLSVPPPPSKQANTKSSTANTEKVHVHAF